MTVYACPACDNRIVVLVTLTHPPTCSRHTGGGKQMKELPDARPARTR